MSGPNHKPNIFSSVSGWPTVAKSGWLSRGHQLPRRVLNDRGRNGKGRGKKLMKGLALRQPYLKTSVLVRLN